MGLVSPRSQAAAAHAEMQVQAELVSRQGSFQVGAVPVTLHAELPVGLKALCLKMGKLALLYSTENYRP